MPRCLLTNQRWNVLGRRLLHHPPGPCTIDVLPLFYSHVLEGKVNRSWLKKLLINLNRRLVKLHVALIKCSCFLDETLSAASARHCSIVHIIQRERDIVSGFIFVSQCKVQQNTSTIYAEVGPYLLPVSTEGRFGPIQLL